MLHRVALSVGLLLFASAAHASSLGAKKAVEKDLPGVVYHGPREQKRIALTFDACSSHIDRVDEKVIDELIALDVPATLFLGGKWMRDQPEVVDRLAAIPSFELGTHGYKHSHLTKMTDQQVRADLQEAVAEFSGVVGRQPALMRTPYAEIDPRVAKIIEGDGITPVQYDLPGADSTFSKPTLIKWVMSQAKPGSIVVLHMNGHGKHTAEALPVIVDGLRKQGYEFVTVSQLLGRPLPQIAEPLVTSSTPDPAAAGPRCALGDDGDSDP